MPAQRIEIYTAGSIASGIIAPGTTLHDRLERAATLEVDDVGWIPLAGPPARSGGRTALAVDDILLAFDPSDDDDPVHAMWHPVLLEAGPYRVRGELPTMPGFDPGRALTRPSGTFVRLRDVRIDLPSRPDAGAQDRGTLLVNRYTVDRISAGLMLGFFFPGADIEEARDVEPVDHQLVGELVG